MKASDARDLGELAAELATMPRFLAEAHASLFPGGLRTAPGGGGFSFVEHVWHLADLEREGYGARIERILGEDEPQLPDFAGDRIAEERGYARLDPEEGRAAFLVARAENLARLRAASAAQRARRGLQEGVGWILLADVPAMMARHDAEHRAAIGALVAQLRRGATA